MIRLFRAAWRFEALNHAGQLQTPMVVILNDNEMSISRNVGALAKYLGHKRASREYTQARDGIQSALEAHGAIRGHGWSISDAT